MPISRSNELLVWMELAKEELGINEIPGPVNNERILEYHQATTLKATDDETAWCSAFVCWVLETCGMKSTRSAAARSYLNWGFKAQGYPYGAVCVLRRGKAWQGHVGFIVGDSINEVSLLSGNQNDSVSIVRYKKELVLDVRWPYRIP